MSTPARERSAFGQFQLNRSAIDVGVDYTKVRKQASAGDMAEMLRDGASLTDVAEVFGLSSSTVTSRLVDAGWSSRDGQPMGTTGQEPVPARTPVASFIDQPWVDQALCAQTDPEMFFPEKGAANHTAKATCAQCFVQAECLDYALTTNERFGVWGGLSEHERRAISSGAASACPDCGDIFYNPSGLLSHQRSQHPTTTERTAS